MEVMLFPPLFFCLSACRVQRHPFERIATPFQVYSWTAPQVDHAMDCVRAEDAYTSRLGYEEHIPGQVRAPNPAANYQEKLKSFPILTSFNYLPTCLQTRDWNEELQTTRELPRKNLPERLLRERAIFKVMNLSGLMFLHFFQNFQQD